MDIRLTRIDDRLIHGQIVTAWLAAADAQQILIADDKAAADAFQRSLLEMATPAGVTLRIASVADTAALIAADDTATRTLLLVRGPQTVLGLVQAGVQISEVNVGNLNMKKGKTKILNTFWIDADDAETFTALHNAGIKLEVRIVPTDRSQDAMDLVKKL